MMKRHLPFLFVLLFSSILLFQLSYENVLLADDLGRVLEADNYTSFIDFLKDFLNTNTMSSRPISGIFYAPSIYFIKYFGLEIYYINYLFYILSLVFIYKVLMLFIDKNLATLSVFLYSILPIGSSIEFSPIMMNSNLATIFYCLSILFIYQYNREEKRERPFIFIILSILFYFLSVLSYEIFLPLILLNAYLLRSKISFKILYVVLLLGLVFGYRQVLEAILFSNYYHRNNTGNIFNLSRNIFIAKDIILNLFVRLPYSIFRGLRAIIYYSIFDFVILIFSIIFNYYIIFKTKYNNIPPFKNIVLLIIGFTFSFVIFLVSDYRPNIWDFHNRNLGAVRLFFTLSLLGIILLFSKKHEKWIKNITFCSLIILNITIISIKNAWIYAHNFNLHLFQELKNHLPKNPHSQNIYITYDKNNPNDRRRFQSENPHFVLGEPIFFQYWEAPYLKNKVNIPQNYQIEFLHYKSSNPSKEYYIFDYKTKTIEFIQE